MREIRNVVEMMAASAQYSISIAGAVVHTEAKQKSNGSIERQRWRGRDVRNVYTVIAEELEPWLFLVSRCL